MLPRVERPPAATTMLDVQHEFFPEFFSRAELLYRRRTYGWTARLSRIVITPSTFVAQTIAERLGVPEERLGRGAVPTMALAQNTLLTRMDAIGPGGWLRMAGVWDMTSELIERFKVRAAGPQAMARSLSGGNLQKFIMGREIDAEPRVLLVSQPTWGVDVGAAAQIRGELIKLRDAGCAILVVSEELDELFEVCARLMVMAQGRLSPSLATADATVEQLGVWMSGLWGHHEGHHAATGQEGGHVQA